MWYLLFDYLTCNISRASSALAALQGLLLQVAFVFGHNMSARHIKMDTEQKHLLEISPSSWWGLKGTHYETEQINFTPKLLYDESLCIQCMYANLLQPLQNPFEMASAWSKFLRRRKFSEESFCQYFLCFPCDSWDFLEWERCWYPVMDIWTYLINIINSNFK